MHEYVSFVPLVSICIQIVPLSEPCHNVIYLFFVSEEQHYKKSRSRWKIIVESLAKI